MGRKTNQQYASSAAGATKSIQLADVLRAKWKNEIKLKSPSQRWAWLGSQEGITAMGAKTASNLRRQLERRHHHVSHAVCSDAWEDAWMSAGELPPGLRFNGDGNTVSEHFVDGRRYSVRLVRSRGLVRNGDSGGLLPGQLPTAGVGTSRWTPPQAVKVEDMLDVMTVKEAEFYDFPPSPSAEQIKRIGWRKGRERERLAPREAVVELSQGRGDDRRIQSTHTRRIH